MGVCLGVPHIYDTFFLCMFLLKSPSQAFLVLTGILCVLNKLHFSFFKKKLDISKTKMYRLKKQKFLYEQTFIL